VAAYIERKNNPLENCSGVKIDIPGEIALKGKKKKHFE
jgi:hypothetical protein